MALPTPADLLNMEYAFQAQPFLNQPAKSTITLLNMEYAFQAQPFVGNEKAAGWSGEISGVVNPAKIMGVDVANIAKVKGVASA